VGQHRAPPSVTTGCGAADVSSQDFFAASPPAAACLCKVAKNSNAPRAPADPSASPKAAARLSFSAPARAPPPFSSEGEPDAGSPVWRASEARRAKARSPRVNEGHDGRSERPVGQHRAPPSVTTGCGVACYCKGRGPCSPAAMAWSVSGRRRHSAAKTRAARVSAVSPGSTGTAAWASTRPLS
jgi:hypothetical protein